VGVAIHKIGDFLKNCGRCTHSIDDVATIACLGNALAVNIFLAGNLSVWQKLVMF
jgi:hypothetical protein